MASYQDSATSTATGANGVTYSYRRATHTCLAASCPTRRSRFIPMRPMASCFSITPSSPPT